MKATLVLLPLLGITYMLFFVNPGEDEVSRVVFIYFNSFLESFQVPPTPPESCYPDSRGRGGPDLHLHGWEFFWQRPGGLGGWDKLSWLDPTHPCLPLPFRASSCLCSTVFSTVR